MSAEQGSEDHPGHRGLAVRADTKLPGGSSLGDRSHRPLPLDFQLYTHRWAHPSAPGPGKWQDGMLRGIGPSARLQVGK